MGFEETHKVKPEKVEDGFSYGIELINNNNFYNQTLIK
jgi:hypothetical protein